MNQLKFLHGGVLVTFLLVAWTFSPGASAQQAYKDSTRDHYVCSDAPQKNCSSFLLYRSRQQIYNNIISIANLFNAEENEIARLSHVEVNATLYVGQPLVIPVSCKCVNQSSTATIDYVIKEGDTFWLLYNDTFEGLSLTQAMVDANWETLPTNLTIGQTVKVPLRCACPSVAQLNSGVKTLMTYSLTANDDEVLDLAAKFDVPASDIQTANRLTDITVLFEKDTLLIPYKVTEPIIRENSPAPPAPGADVLPAPASTPSFQPSSDKSSTNVGLYVGIGVGVGAAVLLVAAICAYLCFARKKRRNRASDGKDGVNALPRTSSPSIGAGADQTQSFATPDDFVGGGGGRRKTSAGDPLVGMFDVMDNDRPTLFTYEEIKDATRNFGYENRIQGSVYRGYLRNQVVAVKQMKGTMSQELKILCKVHHTNLVKLVGICVTDSEHMYLVYEYVENGSLSDCLHTDVLANSKMATKSTSYLGWTVRVQIALDVATGLEYIHDYINPSYVHKDVKSSNILLDGAFRAKIANFAMAKSGGSNAIMTRHIAGTYGYMAPEYLAHGLVTPKADVFAFGVTLLELLSAQEAVLENENGQEACLYSCIGPLLEGDDQIIKTKLREWMDPLLQNNYPLDIAQQLANLAKSCVEPDPAQRPGMKDITYALSKLLGASLEWEQSGVFEHLTLEGPIEAR